MAESKPSTFDSFAIGMLISGFPLIYFLRDGISLLPAGAATTILASVGLLGISFVLKNHSRYFLPNILGYSLTGLFLIITLGYLILRDRYTWINPTSEMLNYTFIFLFYFGFLFIDFSTNGIKILKWVFWLSILGGIGLLIYLTLINPLAFGRRAAIEFREGGSNPHIFSKSAYYGLVSAIVLLKHDKKYRDKYFLILLIGILLFLLLIVLTQTLAAILATSFLMIFYFAYNLKDTVLGMSHLFKKWYFVILLTIGIIGLTKKVSENAEAIEAALGYIELRINSTLNTVQKKEKKKIKISNQEMKGVDISSYSRIQLAESVLERLEENIDEGKFHYVLFGNGYNNLYIDIPHLEVFHCFGFFNFILYTIIFLYVVRLIFREFKTPASAFNEFVAYSYLIYIIYNFTGGLIIDYQRWMSIVLIFRIMKNTSSSI